MCIRDSNRRVVISAAEGAKRPSQGSRGGRRDGSKGRRDNNKPRRDNAARPVKSPVQKQEPVAEATHSAAIKDAEMFADLPIEMCIRDRLYIFQPLNGTIHRNLDFFG